MVKQTAVGGDLLVDGFLDGRIEERGEVEETLVGHVPLRGISHPAGTWANQLWKGTPLSRAKAKSWREAVAMLVIPLAVAEIVW